MIKRYNVDIELVTSHIKTFEVEAIDLKQAEAIALQQADTFDWPADGGEFVVLNSEEAE